MKKIIFIIFSSLIIFLSSCAQQHLCPTYSDSGAYNHKHTPHHLKH